MAVGLENCNHHKTKLSQLSRESAKRLARGEEATDRKEAAAEPEQDQIALGATPAETGHEPVAVGILPTGVHGDDRELPLDIGVLLAESEQALDAAWPQTELVHVLENLALSRHPVQVDEDEVGARDLNARGAVRPVSTDRRSGLADARPLDREVLLLYVAVGVVVLAGLDHVGEGAGVVNGDREGVAQLNSVHALEERDDLLNGLFLRF